jgi:hypothetical protein
MKELYKLDNFNKIFIDRAINDSPIFAYLELLYKAKIMGDDDIWYWTTTLSNYFKTIELDVSNEQIIMDSKTYFPPDVSEEYINEVINSKSFRKENAIAKIRNSRIIRNILTASAVVRDVFIKALETVVKEDREIKNDK